MGMEHEHGHHQSSSHRKLHHDWRLWLVVGLMLAAMLVYVVSDNERFGLGGGTAKTPPPASSTNK
jgi:hypothetical protein